MNYGNTLPKSGKGLTLAALGRKFYLFSPFLRYIPQNT